MTRKMVCFLLVFHCAVCFAEQSTYVGEETRTIKSLSKERISGLLQGKGLGYAKVAELNGYPGPSHVLELAEALELTAEQKTNTENLFKKMQSAAQALGHELVEAEQRLDALFVKGEVSLSQVTASLTQVGILEARLRATHVNAHLAQKTILTPHQVQKYMKLRGYADGKHHKHHASH